MFMNKWAWRWKPSASSTSVEPDFLSLCKDSVDNIDQALANGGNFLNESQCMDMSCKLYKTVQNVQDLVAYCRAPADFFRPTLENLYRYLEKARLLVKNCGNEDRCAAAVFQIRNENAFREILLDVGFCYNAIYEQARSRSQEWTFSGDDLRNTSVVHSASARHIQDDREVLVKGLEDLVNPHNKTRMMDVRESMLKKAARMQCLARYLLGKMNCTSQHSHTKALDISSPILWSTGTVSTDQTWGPDTFLGGGSGGNGVCRTDWLGIPCAKKLYKGIDMQRFFKKEANILAHLKHPGVVNFICCGYDQVSGDSFVAMELMEKSLFKVIEDQGGVHFALPIAVDIMVQMARGMCYLHDQNVAHRDLKPLNVVVNCGSSYLRNYFDVKLVDFGVSKTQVKASMANTMTQAGIGTTLYRAPEVHPKGYSNGGGKATWFKADVWSFAMTCVHLLSLEEPFSGSVRITELYNVLKMGIRPQLPADCPNELVLLLKECWDEETSVRPSFLEICKRLEVFRHKLRTQLSTTDDGATCKYIRMKLDEQSSNQSPFVDNIGAIEKAMEEATNENVKTDQISTEQQLKLGKKTLSVEEHQKIPNMLSRINPNDVVSVIQCQAGHALDLLNQPPEYYIACSCNICCKPNHGEVYHCRGCQFDAHPECAEIKERAEVFFHEHSLHLLVENYYEDDPDAVCSFCKQSVQQSEWVYRCDQCSINAHAICTKYKQSPKAGWLHPHKLTLVKHPIYDSMCCNLCKGDVNGYCYICSRGCPFELHPSCFILAYRYCVYDCSTMLKVKMKPKDVYCGKCGTFELNSSYYHCEHCNVNLHIDCIHDTEEEEEEEEEWNRTYDKFTDIFWLEVQYVGCLETNVNMIELLVNKLFEMSETKIRTVVARLSSSSRPQPVLTERMRVQSKPQKEIVRQIHRCVAAISKLNLQERETTGIAERKAQKMAAKLTSDKEKSKLMVEQDRKLENLERLLQNLHTFVKDRSQPNTWTERKILATHGKLRRMQDIQRELRTIQVKSKTRRVPRIVLCSDVQKTLGGDITEIVLQLLCEEPGHEHVVPNVPGCKINRKNGKGWHRLHPFLATGLQVVPNYLTSLLLDLTFSDKEPQEQSTIIMKRAENSAAHWLESYLKSNRKHIFDASDLSRVRYTVTERWNILRYKQGTFAWLCSEHVILGLRARTLEPSPLRMYHNQLQDNVL